MILKYLKNNYWYLIFPFLSFSLLYFTASFFILENKKIILELGSYNLLSLIFTFIIVTLHSIAINNLIYEKDVIKKPNFVIAFVFILLNTPFFINLEMVVLSFSLLFFLQYLLNLYRKKNPLSLVFNASIILSVLSIFFGDILLLFPLIFISLIIFRNIHWRCVILSIISLFVPYLFLWTYQFLFDLNFYFPSLTFSYNAAVFSFIDLDLHQQIWGSVLIIVVILSGLEIFNWLFKKSIRSRESFSIILFYLMIGLLVFIFSNNVDSIYLVITPLSIVIANFFVYSKNYRVSEILFLLFLFSSIFYRVSMINM